MCGIVGLFLKDPSLEPRFGAMLERMLGTMCDRGPDSAGFAIYRAPVPGRTKITVRPNGHGNDLAAIGQRLSKLSGAEVDVCPRSSHAILSVADADELAVRSAVEELGEQLAIIGSGKRMEVYKEVGLPVDVARRFDLAAMSGTHGIGHTRMATESAVTTRGAHPFSTGPDQCLVHNGSLSNHNAVRRELVREGMTFSTENDTEVAAGYLSWKMRQGLSLKEALEASLTDLDGFYTFVVGTETGFGVLRDAVACKPAIMAETDQYVAFGSEYRVLVDLPGIDEARVWEPEPATVYFWERQ